MKRHIIAILLSVVIGTSFSFAQIAPSTTFFLDNYAYSYRINPAFRPQNTKGFAGFAIDNINVGLHSDYTLSNMLFPIDGKLYTGLNERVSAETFLSGLKDNNRISADINYNLLSFGFKCGEKAFSSFEINLTSENLFSMPKSFFSLLKQGTQNGIYQIDDISIFTSESVEISYGLSYKINDNISVGGRVKALLGLARFDLSMDKLKAVTNEGQMDVQMNGTAQLYQSFVKFDDNFETSTFNTYKPNGLGFAADLGIEYKYEKWDCSLSLQDIGVMSWKKTSDAYIDYNGTITQDISEEEDLSDYASLKQYDTPISERKVLSATIRAGVKYELVKNLSAGLLATYRGGNNRISEARLGLTFTPFKLLSVAVNGGVNNYGLCMGAGLNLRLAFLNFFIVTDSLPINYNPQGVSINSTNQQIATGLVLNF